MMKIIGASETLIVKSLARRERRRGMLTLNNGNNKIENYIFTYEIGTWAANNGYKGLIVPGARGAKSYKNIVIFKQADVDAAFLNKIPTIKIHD